MAAPTAGKFIQAPVEGINFATTYTPYDQTAAISSTNSPDNPGPPFTLGTHAFGSDGSEFVFCKATEAITQYAAVSISTTFSVAHLTLTTLRTLTDYGFAQVAIASGAYGWVAIRGQGIGVLARLSSLANVPCYISSVSAGRVTTTSVRLTSGGLLMTTVLTTSSTTSPSGATVANVIGNIPNRIGG
jgi:hypothetical protein